MSIRRIAIATLFAGFALPAFAASPDVDPAAQKEQQKKVAAEIEQTARRIGTTLRAMRYQKLDRGTEQKMLDEVASTLKGLSDEQVKAVLKHLDGAMKAPDEETASKEQREAYVKHISKMFELMGDSPIELNNFKEL